MAPTTDEMLPDRGAAAAQQALRAAEGLLVFDGRATAWLVVQRVLEVVGTAVLLSGVVFGSVLVGQWVWIVAGVALLLVAWEGPVGRRAGAEPRRWPVGRRLVAALGLLAAVVVAGIVTSGSATPTTSGVSPLALGMVLVAVGYLVAPVVRWARSLRRSGQQAPWPEGAQAYAVLSVLARVQWMHPDRLAELTQLPRASCGEWVSACAVRGLVVPAARRRGHLRNAEITPGGRARLDAWTAELTRRAAEAATAPAPAAPAP